MESNFQHRLSETMWRGIVGDKLTETYILPQRLTSDVYAGFFFTKLISDHIRKRSSAETITDVLLA
jgi:hypothetical protein